MDRVLQHGSDTLECLRIGSSCFGRRFPPAQQMPILVHDSHGNFRASDVHRSDCLHSVFTCRAWPCHRFTPATIPSRTSGLENQCTAGPKSVLGGASSHTFLQPCLSRTSP